MITPAEARDLARERAKALEDYHKAVQWFEFHKDIPVIKHLDEVLRKGHGHADITLEDVDKLMTDSNIAVSWMKEQYGTKGLVVDWTPIVRRLGHLGYSCSWSCSSNYCNERLFISIKE